MGLLKISITSLIFLSINSFAFESQSKKITPLIVGGVDAVKNEFPFQASIQSKVRGHFCGGSLVSSNWVLTAAHCLSDSKDNLQVVMGLHDREKTDQAEIFEIEEIIKHPQYTTHDLQYDIALIKLKGHSKLASVVLNEVELNISNSSHLKAWVAGWGLLSQRNYQLPKILQKVELPLVSIEECNQPVSYNGKVKDHMLCAGVKAGGKDSCQCDSGGPLFVKSEKNEFKLIGIVSYGEGCALPNKYGVYTKVNYFYDWINQQIN